MSLNKNMKISAESSKSQHIIDCELPLYGDINNPSIEQVNLLILWFETELFAQHTRVNEADVAILLKEFLRGVSSIDKETRKNCNFVYRSVKLTIIRFLHSIDQKNISVDKHPITTIMVNRLKAYLTTAS